ncbi:MAG: hypothetical protein HYZ63_03200 [Candidatus Andersenbacteria bacterium]|nr:hypothetical protein [Candidatus Andersenbacteria bacterium]
MPGSCLVPVSFGDPFAHFMFGYEFYFEEAELSALETAFLGLVTHQTVVIDCRNLKEIGSGLLGKLMKFGKRMGLDGNRFILYNLQPNVYDIISITGHADGKLFLICTDFRSVRLATGLQPG